MYTINNEHNTHGEVVGKTQITREHCILFISSTKLVSPSLQALADARHLYIDREPCS